MSSSSKPSTEKPSAWERVAGSKAAVLVILFAVTGALGLPLLCWSPAFSRSAKWFWSIVVILYTILLVGITAAVVWWAYTRLSVIF